MNINKKWHFIIAYVVSYLLYTIFMSDGDNYMQKAGITMAFHLIATIAIVPMIVFTFLNRNKQWFFTLTIILIILTWLLGFFVYSI